MNQHEKQVIISDTIKTVFDFSESDLKEEFFENLMIITSDIAPSDFIVSKGDRLEMKNAVIFISKSEEERKEVNDAILKIKYKGRELKR